MSFRREVSDMRSIHTPMLLALMLAVAGPGFAAAPAGDAAHTTKPAKTAFDPHALAGRWLRTSPFQSYSNVKGGANEFQQEILAGHPNFNRDTGLKYNEAPFTEAGKQAFDKNVPSYGLRITAPRLGNDPQGNCDPWGVPRMLNGQVAGPHATWEILQQPDRMIWFVPWHHEMRMVWTDGRKLPDIDEADPKWNGYSVGHWEGNTFVVNSLGFDDRTWLDHNGYPHSDRMTLEERYRLIDADTLELTMTIVDPQYYSAPFKSDVKIWKRRNDLAKEWDEQIYCVASEEQRFNKLIRDGGLGRDQK
jgi:hypothetical protein